MKWWIFVLSMIGSGIPEAGELGVMSYNIHHGEGVDGKMGLERIAKVIEAEKPDVVALQEVDQGCGRSGGVEQMEWLAKRLGMEGRFGKFMDFDGGEYGLAVLSKLPVKGVEVHRLPAGGEPRVALEVVLESGGGEVSVVGVHFDWVDDDAKRFAQATKLVERLVGRERPVVVVGDFNDVPGSRTIDLFAERGWENVVKKGEVVKTWPAGKPRVEIDFVMVRGGDPGEARVVDERVASDHRPVVATVKIGG